MSAVVNLWSRIAAVGKTGLAWLGVGLLVSVGLLGLRAVPLAQVAVWYVTGGPPLDFDAPHDGQVVGAAIQKRNALMTTTTWKRWGPPHDSRVCTWSTARHVESPPWRSDSRLA